jgi:hypothetical protein
MGRVKPKDIGTILADGRAVDKAIRNAVRAALLQHQRAGNPVAEWRGGKVVWVRPRDILAAKHNGERGDGRRGACRSCKARRSQPR